MWHVHVCMHLFTIGHQVNWGAVCGSRQSHLIACMYVFV